MVSRIFLPVLSAWLVMAGVASLAFVHAKDKDALLFESGVKHLQHERFVEARLDFQTLINTYPDSQYTPFSFLICVRELKV